MNGLLLLLGLFGLAAAPASAQTVVYVRQDATGANDGTSWINAYTDLNDAIDYLDDNGADGDQIWVAKGTYTSDRPDFGAFSVHQNIGVYGGFWGSETMLSQRDWVTNVTILSAERGDPGDPADNFETVVSTQDFNPVIDGFTITGGYADAGGIFVNGGGILARYGSPVLRNLIVTGNTAQRGGGFACFSTAALVNVVFYNNTATSTGGAVQIGGPSYGACTATLTNVTITQNTAPVGGALYTQECCNVQTVRNAIIYGNSSTGGGSDVAASSSSFNLAYSLVEGVTFGAGVVDGGNNVVDEDPLFTNAAGGDFTVQSGSPVIDAGSAAALPADADDIDGDTDVAEALPYAMGGTVRIFDGDGDTDPIVDLGAYEYGAPHLLPVELVAFDVVRDGAAALLRWATASETNNAGFTIEQRAGDAAWTAVGFVSGHGTTTEARQYMHRVDHLSPGRYTFRLKQVDYDGAFEYSPEVELSVDVAGAFHLSAVYPNPFNPAASFALSVQEPQQVRVSVYDVLGREVARLFDGRMDAGRVHAFRIDGAGLPSGMYLVRAAGEHFTAVQHAQLVK